jgi:hypothetical protein
MGWWRTDSGAIIGDEPADLVARELAAISEMLFDTRGRRLGLGELLGYLHLVIRTKARDLLDAEPEGEIAAVMAELEIFEDDDNRRVRIEMSPPTRDAVRDRVDQLCAQISAHYVEALERRPELRELLAQIRFVLGHDPASCLDVPPASRVVRIWAQPGEGSAP